MRLLNKVVREQVVVWKVSGVCANDSSSPLQYPAGIWLQAELAMSTGNFLEHVASALACLVHQTSWFFISSVRSGPFTLLDFGLLQLN